MDLGCMPENDDVIVDCFENWEGASYTYPGTLVLSLLSYEIFAQPGLHL
jgi:hypothetical protein